VAGDDGEAALLDLGAEVVVAGEVLVLGPEQPAQPAVGVGHLAEQVAAPISARESRVCSRQWCILTTS
jgi:hypothetical protein